MTLLEFINHIKHNSLYVDIFGANSAKIYYCGAIGSYKTSVIKSKIGSMIINKIEPLVTSLNIYIVDGDNNE